MITSDSIDKAIGVSFYSKTRQQEMRYIYPDANHHWAGWILAKHPDGGWYSLRKATHKDLAEIHAAVRITHHTLYNGCDPPVKNPLSHKTTDDPIYKALGPTWCFDHSCPLPCEECDGKTEAFKNLSRCFDCKHLIWGPSRDPDIKRLEKYGVFNSCSCSSIQFVLFQGVKPDAAHRYP